MDVLKVLGALLALCHCSASAASKLFSGQRICRRGTEKPCYKIAYFQDSRRKMNFEEASRACRSDGGELLSIESENEQRLIETFIQELRAADGDFWIGLHREPGYQETSSNCHALYHWLDGSQATFRNWHGDEPSCGYEVCVVMYHQPSAPPGHGGLYMFQWNDDNCDTKNNFICKYTRDKRTLPTTTENFTNTDTPTISLSPKYPSVTSNDKEVKVRVPDPTDNALNIAYIVLPTIPLLLLLLVATGVFCFKLLTRRKKEQTETCPKEPGYWVSAERCNSPSPDVYNVIRKQHDADLAGTRPDIKNTSFLGSSPDTPPGDYDNLTGRDTESGFVTLASTESGFVTNDIYETCHSRGRYCRETGWVDNEIYGY
ncbi:layilin isoform X2 [Scleropages formosus]|uniref:Layilin n=1 Tax=Scleropages formosus TaxID=113540 RepID=A0A8C9RLI4_SCLFO|nr:layilin isoform X2 [Scleropages formosus]